MSTPNIWERFTVHLSRFLNLVRITWFDDWFPAIFVEKRMLTHGFGQPKRLAESLSFVTVTVGRIPELCDSTIIKRIRIVHIRSEA